MIREKKQIIKVLIFIFLFLTIFLYHAFNTREKVRIMYNQAILSLEKNDCTNYNQAIQILTSIRDYKDSETFIINAKKTLEKYEDSKKLYNERKFDSAVKSFEEILYFDDSKIFWLKSKYYYAKQLYDENKFESSIQLLEEINEYEETKSITEISEYKNLILDSKYEYANQLLKNKKYDDAYKLYKELKDYKDSEDLANEALLYKIKITKKETYKSAEELFKDKNYKEAYDLYSALGDYKDSKQKAEECQKFIDEERERIKRRYDKTVSAGLRYTLYITDEGKVHSTAYDKMPESEDYNWQAPIENWRNIKSISGFDAVIIGITNNNEVVVENNGNEGFNYVNTDTSDWNNIIKVCAGTNYALGLTSDGFVKVYGYSEYQETHNQFEHYTTDEIDVLDWTEIVDIATSWRTSAGLTKDGEIKVVGYGSDIIENDIENNAEKWKDVIAISLNGGRSPNVDDDYTLRGDVYLAGLKKDGTVVIAGLDSKNEELWKQRDCENDEEWHDIMEISAGDWYVVGLRNDGKVLITGKNHSDIKTDYIESDFDGWDDFGIVNVDAGYGQIIGLTSTGLIKSMIFVEEQGIDENDWKNVKTNNYLEK